MKCSQGQIRNNGACCARENARVRFQLRTAFKGRTFSRGYSNCHLRVRRIAACHQVMSLPLVTFVSSVVCHHVSVKCHYCFASGVCVVQCQLDLRFCYTKVERVCLLVACFTSQQHASVSRGRICLDNFACCHTEIEVADQTFHLTQ